MCHIGCILVFLSIRSFVLGPDERGLYPQKTKSLLNFLPPLLFYIPPLSGACICFRGTRADSCSRRLRQSYSDRSRWNANLTSRRFVRPGEETILVASASFPHESSSSPSASAMLRSFGTGERSAESPPLCMTRRCMHLRRFRGH